MSHISPTFSATVSKKRGSRYVDTEEDVGNGRTVVEPSASPVYMAEDAAPLTLGDRCCVHKGGGGIAVYVQQPSPGINNTDWVHIYDPSGMTLRRYEEAVTARKPAVPARTCK